PRNREPKLRASSASEQPAMLRARSKSACSDSGGRVEVARRLIAGQPWRFSKSVREVQLLAFSTSSSATVMPLSMKTAEEQLGVRPSISQFVIPLGATINMNGTALYQGVATVFSAQVF